MFTTCTQLAADVATCQAAGKKILVSLGGDSPGNTLASPVSAQNFADFLWGSYGPAVDKTATAYPRPFGQTIVDGFDLDIESGGDDFYSDLVNELRVKFATYTSKQFYISAAPQCIVPDAHLDKAITLSTVDIVYDSSFFVWVWPSTDNDQVGAVLQHRSVLCRFTLQCPGCSGPGGRQHRPFVWMD